VNYYILPVYDKIKLMAVSIYGFITIDCGFDIIVEGGSRESKVL
jgi:hypothetical protein